MEILKKKREDKSSEREEFVKDTEGLKSVMSSKCVTFQHKLLVNQVQAGPTRTEFSSPHTDRGARESVSISNRQIPANI